MNKIHFRKKSLWQKDDCINGNCKNNSVIETEGTSCIRCCENHECCELAEELAKIPSYPCAV